MKGWKAVEDHLRESTGSNSNLIRKLSLLLDSFMADDVEVEQTINSTTSTHPTRPSTRCAIDHQTYLFDCFIAHSSL